MLTYNSETKKFIWCGGYETRDIPKSAGMRWNPTAKEWWTDKVDVAMKVNDCDTKAISAIKSMVEFKKQIIVDSMAESSDVAIPCPDGLSYLPYQVAGINYALKIYHLSKSQ